jgi:hypothetical protein
MIDPNRKPAKNELIETRKMAWVLISEEEYLKLPEDIKLTVMTTTKFQSTVRLLFCRKNIDVDTGETVWLSIPLINRPDCTDISPICAEATS